MADAISRAEKKLRQAEFFLHYLAAVHQPGRTDETMEFYFSATLSAARSAFYIMRDHGGPPFNRAHEEWQAAHVLDMDFHKRMKDLRDDDVHEGTTDAKSLNKFMDARP